MKAIYILIFLAPIYIFLVLEDFIYSPIDLIMPASIVLVCLWQVAGSMLIKKLVTPSVLNPAGAVCAVGSFIYGWYLILNSGMPIVTLVISLIIWTIIMAVGVINFISHYEKGVVNVTAAGGLALVLSGVLIRILLGITGDKLAVFFAVSLAPLALVLFFYSMAILSKRPEQA